MVNGQPDDERIYLKGDPNWIRYCTLNYYIPLVQILKTIYVHIYIIMRPLLHKGRTKNAEIEKKIGNDGPRD